EQAVALEEATEVDDITDVVEIIDEVVEETSEETDGGISVVPVPASAALLLAGLGGLVAMRRKKS
ncbi:MAG: VPLPA-CTERM sorting domain-containing protein, partial [Paracoccaceae bacterium]